MLQSQIPVAEQRLIYKGRVLKDEQTVEALGACVYREVPRWKEGRRLWSERLGDCNRTRTTAAHPQ